MTRLALIAGLVCVASAAAQPAPDPSYAHDGVALVESPVSMRVRGVDAITSPDGSTTMAVQSTTMDWRDPGSSLARLTPDGSPDAAFGPAGLREVLLPAGMDALYIERLTGLPDGRMAAAGEVKVFNGPVQYDYYAVVILFHPDGRPDTTFSDDGFAVLPRTVGEALSHAYAISYVGGGLVVAGTVFTSGSGPDGFVSRFTLEGKLDTTFGTSGTTLVTGPDHDQFYDLAAFPDGRLLAVGYNTRQATQQDDALFVRLDAAGRIETTNGVIKRDLFGGSRDRAVRATLLPDGRALVAGTTRRRIGSVESDGTTLFVFRRDGSPETDFGSEGWTWTDAIPSPYNNANWEFTNEWPGRPFAHGGGFAVPVGQPTSVYEGEGGGLALSFQHQDGQPDASAGPGGVVRLFAGYNLSLVATAPPVDGRLVAAGWHTSMYYPQNQKPAAVRVRLTGATPTAEAAVPEGAVALAIVPNPVAASARVTLALDAPATVSVRVVDALGRTVAVLADGSIGAGPHTFGVDAGALAPGVYAVVAMVGHERSVTRMTVVR